METLSRDEGVVVVGGEAKDPPKRNIPARFALATMRNLHFDSSTKASSEYRNKVYSKKGMKLTVHQDP